MQSQKQTAKVRLHQEWKYYFILRKSYLPPVWGITLLRRFRLTETGLEKSNENDQGTKN